VVLAEDFDDEKQEFVEETFPLQLEHSLLSLSKWESIFEKPFLGTEDKTDEETFAYIQAMIVTDNVPLKVFTNLSEANIKAINDYINGKNTATTFHDHQDGPSNREIITAEIITNWMIACKIPIEWGERQHLNKLFAVIRTVNLKNQPAKKMPRRDMIAQRKALNEKRRAEMGTRG
jgi:hypothetical protein